MEIYLLQFETNTVQNEILGAFCTVDDAVNYAEIQEGFKGNKLQWESFFNLDPQNFNIGFSEPCDDIGSYYIVEKMEVQECRR